MSNYDVRLTVTSSRHAALDWGDGTLLLPVCTNLVLRLRLGSDAVKSVTLSPAPSAASSPGGAWKASVRAEWDPRRGLPTEGNSVALDDGTMVDRSVSESRFVGVLPPPSRTSLPWGLIRPDMIFVPKALRFSPDPALRFLCANHDANPQVDVAARNLGQEDLAWLENGVPVGTGGTNHVLQTSLAPGETRTVVCTVHEPYENLRLQAACQIEGKQCRPGRTNLVGAAWTSTHDPFSPIDHAPGIETADVVFGPHCPMAHDMTVRVGWTHDSTVLHARNLPVVPSGDAEYDSVDHCIGLPWTAGGEIDLLSYLAPECRPFLDRLSFSLNGVLCPDWVPCGPKPDSLYPRAFLVSVWSSGSGRPLDTMVLTIYSPNDATEFATWYTRNLSSWQWTLDLPPPPPHLPSGATEAWHAPETPGRFMHHDAVYELRSKPINGGHGHQATYDGNGQLITSTIAAGTADFAAPESVIEGTVQMHRNEDVYPYIRALHLDGNPGLPDNGAGWMTKTIPCRLSLPCIYQGRNVNDYISLRPTLPTGIQTP